MSSPSAPGIGDGLAGVPVGKRGVRALVLETPLPPRWEADAERIGAIRARGPGALLAPVDIDPVQPQERDHG